MTRYMLDTNTVSHLIKQHPAVTERVVTVPMASLCISSITKGELMFGLAKRPEAKRLRLIVKEFLLRVDVQPWDSAVADCYGMVRADLARQGKTLGPLDLLIAAHALAIGAILVTNDQVFGQVDGLYIDDWTA
ncbi:MAG: type II toxin-antitoxin system VapC family toxin [Magnetococcus sp. YQC-5]